MAGALDMPVTDRVELERVARSTVEPHRRVVQAKALLALADGTPVETTAQVLGTWPKTVRRAQGFIGGVEHDLNLLGIHTVAVAPPEPGDGVGSSVSRCVARLERAGIGAWLVSHRAWDRRLS